MANAITPAKIKASERAYTALMLRKEGKTYKEIGQALGVTETSALRLVRRAYERLVKLVDETAEFNREIDLQRLENLYATILPQAQQGNLWAIDRVLAILDRKAKLLGLDAYKETDIGDALAAVLERLAHQDRSSN